ncbi:MAG: hypothetical protein KKA19_03080 [Candidatus Margulisbacteria bacterium]|nr:hypothetical protein [Candidatus Margulisiibacteriota bacterium]
MRKKIMLISIILSLMLAGIALADDDLVKCPVTGQTLHKAAAEIIYYNYSTYYVCSPEARTKFWQNPQKYVNGM